MFIVSIRRDCRRERARRWSTARALRGLALPVVSGFMPAAAHAQNTLTLDQALRLAEQRSHRLIAQDKSAAAAREMSAASARLPAPVLEASISNLPIDGADLRRRHAPATGEST